MNTTPQSIAPNVWLLSYPLKALGADLKRNVTVIQLASGKLIIHSTGPFTSNDVRAIAALGDPAWLVDSLLRHDTFSKQGHEAFPSAQYLAPTGFPQGDTYSTTSLLPPPPEWSEEIAVLAVEGAPDFGEVVMLHKPSRTLIVADLIFNFRKEQNLWTKLLLFAATVGGKHDPGMTRPFKKAIKDEAAFSASMRTLLSWDFDRIIVGHGVPVESGGKEKFRATLQGAGISGI